MRSKILTGLFVVAIVVSMGSAFGHSMSEADQLRAQQGGYVEFIRQGAVHMVTGYDHLLFLIGVLFFLSGFKKVVKFVTAFTLGHCITLISATFLGIQANYFLVDTVIALTVCYKGFDNIGGFKKYFNMESPHLLGMVFIFGLIHGFGLSTRLQQLTIGEGWDLLMKILCFNFGVELGQIFALTIILTLLSAWRHTKSFDRFAMATNIGLIIVGALLCLMQLHGYTHEQHLNSYPFNVDAHTHIHEDMASGLDSGNPELPPGWHLDEGDTVPHAPHDNPTLPPGWHFEEGDPIPRKDQGHSHAASEGTDFSKTVDKFFEIRTGYKEARNAKTAEEVQAAHPAIVEVLNTMGTLREQVVGVQHVPLDIYDAIVKSATEAVKAVETSLAANDADKAREAVQAFDKSVLAIEELVMHGNVPDYHTDAENPVPHKH